MSSSMMDEEKPNQENKAGDIDAILREMDVSSDGALKYLNLAWRYEVKLASRSLKNQLEPRIVLRFEFRGHDGNKKFVTLQSDPANLVHLTNSLEEALIETKSQHAMKMMRHLK